MKQRKSRIFVGDFETTVYEGQDHTEVWASASVELFTEDVNDFHSIDEQFEYFRDTPGNIICYYHNLKFDGNFWIAFLLKTLHYQQAVKRTGEGVNDIEFLPIKDMPNNSFTYSIASLGQWYRIIIKTRNKIIELRDSLKLLPFTVKRIGMSFGTKHKKLDIEYKGLRYAGCPISDKEKEYIKNDVLVIKEAMEIMFNEGHNKLTIGSCCLEEYKKSIDSDLYKEWFPNLYQLWLNPEQYGCDNEGEYIRQSYHGGWCYLVKGKEGKLFHNGTTADVNSLYPSMMSLESGNLYPVGEPIFWHGNEIPAEALAPDKFFFVRFKTRFYLKPNKLPFIQIKHNLLYKSTEMLETSDIYSKEDGLYHTSYINTDGELEQAIVTLTMTQTDFQLLQEHYYLVDFEILDGCYFEGVVGLFESYINKYKKIKLENKGAKRELAKLFLNNLYGKMASNTNSSFKVAYEKPDGSIGYYVVMANDKQPGYIPVGSAITSYARNFTIRAAQKNYHGVDKPGFIYADTDSIHCDLPPEQIVGIKVHPKDFCCWKLEACWDTGYFIRQKTYVEHVVKEDLEDCEPYYNIKCAGMPEHCKDLFLASMGCKALEYDKLTEEERNFVKTKRTLEDFNIGLKIPGKLIPRTINGGVLLMETTYEMR